MVVRQTSAATPYRCKEVERWWWGKLLLQLLTRETVGPPQQALQGTWLVRAADCRSAGRYPGPVAKCEPPLENLALTCMSPPAPSFPPTSSSSSPDLPPPFSLPCFLVSPVLLLGLPRPGCHGWSKVIWAAGCCFPDCSGLGALRTSGGRGLLQLHLYFQDFTTSTHRRRRLTLCPTSTWLALYRRLHPDHFGHAHVDHLNLSNKAAINRHSPPPPLRHLAFNFAESLVKPLATVQPESCSLGSVNWCWSGISSQIPWAQYPRCDSCLSFALVLGTTGSRHEPAGTICVLAATAALLAAYTIFSAGNDVASTACAAMENFRDGGQAVPLMPQLAWLEKSYTTSCMGYRESLLLAQQKPPWPNGQGVGHGKSLHAKQWVPHLKSICIMSKLFTFPKLFLGPLSSFEAPFCSAKNEARGPQALQGA